MAAYTPDSLARRNTLACLGYNHLMYARAGNLGMAEIFKAAFERRLELIESQEVAVGTWERAA